MEIHDNTDSKGAGMWDSSSTRYIPMWGGSRSRLPLSNGGKNGYPRYHGFVGIDESLTPNIYTIGGLYHHMGTGVFIPEGPAGVFISLLLEQAAPSHAPVNGDE